MKSILAPTIAFDDYWQFACSRQKALILKQSGIEDSQDEILNTYKFTNCYRALDRTSQFLIGEVMLNKKHTPEDTFLRTLTFKIFNKSETWQKIEASQGELLIESFHPQSLKLALSKLKSDNDKIYSAAYIMPSGKSEYGSAVKHENSIDMISHMLKLEYHKKIWDLSNLKEIYELFLKVPSIGKFLAYQYSIDIAYSEYSRALESDFIIAGPGAERGIRKCFPNAGKNDFSKIIQYVTDSQEEHFSRLGLIFPGLKGRKLQLIDCQNLFCEIDKYLRVKRPELGKPGSRIKQKYFPRPADGYFFIPPKWNICKELKTYHESIL